MSRQATNEQRTNRLFTAACNLAAQMHTQRNGWIVVAARNVATLTTTVSDKGHSEIP